jgi:hypothetical protein
MGLQVFDIEYRVIDTIQIGGLKGGTYLQLVVNKYSKNSSPKEYVRIWSSLSKQWNIIYRYNVTDSWNKWKRTEKTCQHTH